MSDLPLTFKVNKGQIEIGGVPAAELVKEFGTPLYVLDEKTLRERSREYKTSFKSRYPNTEIIYAAKAFCSTAILKIMQDEGLGADVVSGGELQTALKAGMNPRKIYFHGNNKSAAEIEMALKSSVGRIVVDNFDELKRLDDISIRTGMRADCLIRVNPGIEAHTHEFIQTGRTDSKFGILKERVLEAVSLIDKMRNANFIGLHAHIGSQIFDLEPFSAEIDVLLGIAKDIYDKTNIGIEELNIGGGLGINYLDEDKAPGVDALASSVTTRLKETVKSLGIEEPRLILEPGRSIVGPAGVTLYTVGAIKEIPGIRKYVCVDGGMSDNPRPILYGAKYDALIANKADRQRTEKVTIAGRFCESGDVLIRDIMIQAPEIGDIVLIPCTGAYNYSMSSNYNRVPRPPVVLVSDGSPTLIVARESYDDLTSRDVLV